MTTIFQTIKRLERFPRHHRIAHLRALIQSLPARSIRRQELESYLIVEMLRQLRKESRAA